MSAERKPLQPSDWVIFACLVIGVGGGLAFFVFEVFRP